MESKIAMLLIQLSAVLFIIVFECVGAVPSTEGCHSYDQLNPKVCNLCDCYNSNTYIDCSEKDLLKIPQGLPMNLFSLNLYGNNISSVSKHALDGCEHIRRLDLSGNGLIRIDPDAFSYARHLNELNLHDNKLDFNSPESYIMFKPLKQSLKILSIQHNTAYSDRIFGNLISLKNLSIQSDDDFGRGFMSLTELTILTVYYTSSNITNNTFVNFSESPVREFKIVSNNLAAVEPLSFSHFKFLEILDLSYNQQLTLDGASQAWYGLKFTNITTLILTRVNRNDEYVAVKSNFFSYLENTKISKMKLNRNNIVELGKGFSTHLPGLKHLDLSFNRMSKVAGFVNDVTFLKKLSFLDCSGQIRRYVNKREAWGTLPKVGISDKVSEVKTEYTHHERKKLKFNKDDCRAAAVGECKLNSLSKMRYGQGHTGNGQFNFGTSCLIPPRNLEILNVSESITITMNKVPTILLIGTVKIKHFECKSNGLNMITGPIMINRPRATEPITFDASDNGIICFAKDLLSYSVSRGLNIGKIILSGNNLGEQIAQDREGETFSEYRNLSELNLANNKIKTLPSGVFIKIPHLTKLNLSDNSLQVIEFDNTHFDRLEMLDLSSNLLTQLGANNQVAMTNLMRQFGNFSLNIYGNPLQCSCESLNFLKWLKRSKFNIANYENTSCLYGQKIYKFSTMDDVLNKLEFECSKTLALKISGSIFALAILGMIFSVCLYRHRWDIRYCMLQMSHKGQKYQRLVEQNKNYVYDAFVAYDKDDRGWVKNELITHMETPNNDDSEHGEMFRKPMRLCIHERDFELGNWIEENIVTAIEQSRRIILVISSNFLNSNWCRFELEMARMHSMERGRNIVVPILMGNVAFEDMPASLQLIVRKHTYIEWKEETGDREEFWDRLRDVLSNVENSAFVCECGRVQ